MTYFVELARKIAFLERALQKEIKRRKFLEKSFEILTGRVSREIPIPKKELSKQIKKNKPTREIVVKFTVTQKGYIVIQSFDALRFYVILIQRIRSVIR